LTGHPQLPTEGMEREHESMTLENCRSQTDTHAMFMLQAFHVRAPAASIQQIL